MGNIVRDYVEKTIPLWDCRPIQEDLENAKVLSKRFDGKIVTFSVDGFPKSRSNLARTSGVNFNIHGNITALWSHTVVLVKLGSIGYILDLWHPKMLLPYTEYIKELAANNDQKIHTYLESLE